MEAIFQYIYTRELWWISLFFALVIILWVSINHFASKGKLCKKVWKTLNIVCFVLMIGVILYYTVFARSSHIQELNLKPFHTFELAKENVEFYRSMLMNLFLFIPFGLTLFVALPDKCRSKLLLTVLSAVLFSIMLELTQYAFALGRTEVDDVICNTLGACIGALPYAFINAKI